MSKFLKTSGSADEGDVVDKATAAVAKIDALDPGADIPAEKKASMRKEITSFLKTFGGSFIGSFTAGLVDEITAEKAAEIEAAADVDLDAVDIEGERAMSPDPEEVEAEAQAEEAEEAAIDEDKAIDGPSAAAQKEGKLTHRPRTAHARPTAAPLKTGMILKRGAVKKNWKERFAVVRTDYVVEYYESEEAYTEGAKPKGMMQLEGYKVVRDPNARKVAAKKELRERFGIEGDVEYTKYEPLTLEIFHPIRRRWLMRFATQEEFDAWAEMFDQVVLRARSRTLRDPIAARAFQNTFEELRTPLDVPSGKVIAGTEQDMLVELLFLHMEHNFLQVSKESKSKVPSTPAIRYKFHLKRVSFVKSTVASLVTAQWKTMRSSLQGTRKQIKAAIRKMLGPVGKAKNAVTAKVSAVTKPVVGPLTEKILSPAMSPLARGIGKALAEVYANFGAGFARVTDAYVEAMRQPDADVLLVDRKLEEDIAQPTVLTEAFARLNLVAKVCSSIAELVPDAVKRNFGSLLSKLETGFDVSGYVRRQERNVLILADAAAYSFSELYKANPTGDVKAMQAEIVAAFFSDAQGVIEEAMADFCADAINDIFVMRCMEKCRPLTQSLDAMIPSKIRRFVSVSGCLEMMLAKLVRMGAASASSVVAAEIKIEAVAVGAKDQKKKK